MFMLAHSSRVCSPPWWRSRGIRTMEAGHMTSVIRSQKVWVLVHFLLLILSKALNHGPTFRIVFPHHRSTPEACFNGYLWSQTNPRLSRRLWWMDRGKESSVSLPRSSPGWGWGWGQSLKGVKVSFPENPDFPSEGLWLSEVSCVLFVKIASFSFLLGTFPLKTYKMLCFLIILFGILSICKISWCQVFSFLFSSSGSPTSDNLLVQVSSSFCPDNSVSNRALWVSYMHTLYCDHVTPVTHTDWPLLPPN